MYKNYEDKLNTILSNAKGEKVEKVELALLDDIEKVILRALKLKDAIIDATNRASDELSRALVLVRGDMDNQIIEAEKLLNKFEADVKELGIDLPARAKQLRNQIEDAELLQKDLERDIRNIKIK